MTVCGMTRRGWAQGLGKVVRQRSEIGGVGAIRRRGGSCTGVAAPLAGIHMLRGDRSILLEATLPGPWGGPCNAYRDEWLAVVSRHSLERGRRPGAIEGGGLRGVQPHGQVEGPGGSWQPVRLLVCARRVVLNVQIQRAVGVVGERIAVTECEPVQGVGHRKALVVVQGYRPER